MATKHQTRRCRTTRSISRETVQNAAQGLLLRTIKGARVESVSVVEIKAEL
jgi:hypothetical protein